MSLKGAKPQKFKQLKLPLEYRSEAPKTPRSEEAPTAANGNESSGASDLLILVIERQNLQAALKRVRQNKGSPGIDGMTVEELPHYLKEHWPRIRQEVLEGTYRPKPVRRQQIPKNGGGVRELGIPCVLDRFLQQAILQVLQPRFDPTFSEHSHGFRPGRSAHDAVRQAQKYLQEGRLVVVDCDLEKFFDQANRDVLMGKLAKRLGDKRLLRLIRHYLEAGIMVNGVVMDKDEGMPQGGPLSPLLANVLLDDVDKELERRGHCFVRYADDCNVYVRSRRAGERVLDTLRQLYAKLRLHINEKKSAVALGCRRKFLGYSFYVAKGGIIKRRVAKKALEKMKARIRRLTSRSRGRSLRQVVKDLRDYLPGWKNYFKLADTIDTFRKLDSWIRRRLRALHLKHWKQGPTVFKRLRARGTSVVVAARVASQTRRWWHNSRHFLHIALPNRYFDKMGVPRLAT